MLTYILLGGIGLGLSYYNREYLKKKMISNLWSMTRNYHIISIYLEDFHDTIKEYTEKILKTEHNYNVINENNTNDVKKNEEEEMEYIVFDINTLKKKTYTINEFDSLKDNEIFNELILLKYNNLFKRINKSHKRLKDLDFVKAKFDLFLSVELLSNQKHFDLTNILKPYYLVGNKILDKKFIQWLVYDNFKIANIETYVINLIDNDINVKQIDENDIITINEENSYTVTNTKI